MNTTLPTNWEFKPLRELLVSFESGSRPKGGVKGIESGVPSLGGEHLDSNGGFKFEKIKFVPEVFAQKMTRGRIQSGDILIVKDGATTGKTSFVGSSFPYQEAVINEHVFLCRCREGIDSKYVFYFLYSAEGNRQILEDFRGAAQGGISQRFAEIVNVPLAPLDQQKRIVAEIEKQFSRLDEAVANLKRVKANLKRYKAAVLKAAVEGRLVETEAELARRAGVEAASRRLGQRQDVAATYETGEQLLQRILAIRRCQWQGKGKYKEPAAPDTTDLPELPEGWVWASLGSLGNVIGGLTKNPKRAALPMKLPYLRVANVYANELRLKEIEEIGVENRELEKLLMRKGDLLIVEGNGSPDHIGRLAIWDGSINPCVHQNHLIKVRLPAECTPEWVVSWFISLDGRHHIRNIASSTSGLYTLSVGKVANLPVPLPPNDEQHRIIAEVDRRLSLIHETEVQINVNLKRAERLRQSLLSQAFSGQLLATIATNHEGMEDDSLNGYMRTKNYVGARYEY